jgi:hypothetical protein
MDQLTLLLAASTCKLSDVMKLIRQQEVLIETLQAQERPTAGAEALLAIFRQAATAITDQRERLEAQIVVLAQKAPGSNVDIHGYQLFAVFRRAFAALWPALNDRKRSARGQRPSNSE